MYFQIGSFMRKGLLGGVRHVTWESDVVLGLRWRTQFSNSFYLGTDIKYAYTELCAS